MRVRADAVDAAADDDDDVTFCHLYYTKRHLAPGLQQRLIMDAPA